MITVRTYSTIVSEYHFDDEVGEDEAKRLVMLDEYVEPDSDYSDFDIEVFTEDE